MFQEKLLGKISREPSRNVSEEILGKNSERTDISGVIGEKKFREDIRLQHLGHSCRAPRIDSGRNPTKKILELEQLRENPGLWNP